MNKRHHTNYLLAAFLMLLPVSMALGCNFGLPITRLNRTDADRRPPGPLARRSGD